MLAATLGAGDGLWCLEFIVSTLVGLGVQNNKEKVCRQRDLPAHVILKVLKEKHPSKDEKCFF